MNQFSKEELKMAQNAIHSTIRKSEKVIQTLSIKESSKPAQIKRVEERLHVFYTADSLLMIALDEKPIVEVTKTDLENLKRILPPIKKQIEDMLYKFSNGTSQHTLAIRRIKAFEIVLELAK